MAKSIDGKQKLNNSFFEQQDVVHIARQLLGKRLVTENQGVRTAGIISETEAYAGRTDKASHAWNGRYTSRTATMYGRGGSIYVFLCYGIHSLFNIVTNKKGVPDAVLIRGVIPTEGMAAMLQRRKAEKVTASLADGPGKVSQALGIHYSYTGMMLDEEQEGFRVWVEEGQSLHPGDVAAAPRIGIDYAKEDADLPWRFYIKKAHRKR